MATIPIRMSLTTPPSSPISRPIFFTPARFPSFPLHTTETRNHLLLCFTSRNGTECPVPREQLPLNEYQSLSTSFPFSWAAGDVVEYSSRLAATGLSFALFVGLPVALFGSVGSQSELLKRVLCAASSGVGAVTLAVVRMYLGWAYVGNRLLSATVEYEETGWYDGQIWVKTAEVLARDRLLGSFSVKPVLRRLKITLVSLGTCLLACALILINIDGYQNELNLRSNEAGVRVIPGVYNDDSARSFEPDAFCGSGEPADLQ